jgi:hypothetical protein
MGIVMFLYFAALFYLMTPGVLVVLPEGASQQTVRMTHAALFAVIALFTKGYVWKWAQKL